MSEKWNATVGEALRLTRGGQLAQATSLLQRGLADHAAGPQPGVGAEDLAGQARARPSPPSNPAATARPARFIAPPALDSLFACLNAERSRRHSQR
jgi:hypothetical protein